MFIPNNFLFKNKFLAIQILVLSLCPRPTIIYVNVLLICQFIVCALPNLSKAKIFRFFYMYRCIVEIGIVGIYSTYSEYIATGVHVVHCVVEH